jgi:LPS export ABC transporter protein LptC
MKLSSFPFLSLVFCLTFGLTGAIGVRAQEAVDEAAAESVDGSLYDTPAVDQKMEGFNLVGYNETGSKSWDINGDKADITGDQVAVTNVNANAYGEESMNLKAMKGRIDKVTGDVSLERNVVITSDQGRQMKTDSLEWQREQDLVSTPDKVHLTDDNMVVEGTGLQAHPTLKDARLNSDVRADIAMEGDTDNRIQVTSDGPMEVDQLSMRAIFRDNVVAVELASGRRMKADMMEIYFDKESRKIREIICVGNVELHQGVNVTYSERLVYKADQQRVVLSGKPKLLIDTGNVDTQKVFQY